jgi:hypothetical protein
VHVPGIRQPIMIVLLLIAFFSAISGKPLDGLLMLLVAAGLAWDAARAGSREAAAAPPGGPGSLRQPGLSAVVLAEPPAPAAPSAPAGRRPREGWRTAAAALAWAAAGIGYAVLVGSFARFSWPATMAVVGLATLVIVIGWQGPVHPRPDPGPLPKPGLTLWGGVLLAGGLWELLALAQQPSLDVTSLAHPTLSALTDPVLASHSGRSLALAVWLLVGGYLVRR